MSKYTGKPSIINQPIDDIYAKVSDLGSYQTRLDSLPEEIKSRIGNVRFTDESIIINTPPVGVIKFNIIERNAPELIRLAAEQSPVPFEIILHLSSIDENSTRISSELEVEIPMMLRPMVGGKLQEAADKFGELISTFFANNN